MNGQWAEVLSSISAGLSSVIAFVAILIAVLDGRRSREVARTQIYLALRDRFIGIYEKLGDTEVVVPSSTDERLAREAYWHHSFDEWYVSNKLASREFEYMWAEFYKPAIVSGYDEPALRSTLEELLKDPKKGFREYTKEFMSSLGDGRAKRLRPRRLLPRHLR